MKVGQFLCPFTYVRKVVSISIHLSPIFLFKLVQIWCSLTFMTDIAQRVVCIRMRHVTGTLQKCIDAAKACDHAILQSMRLSRQHEALVEAAQERLKTIDV
jgi:hypothetical protein